MTAMLGACLLSILASSAAASSSEPTLPAGPDERAWTFLFYGGGDNDSEESFLPDMASLAASFSAADAIELLFFVDRSARYSASAQFFGEDFHDSRLYRFDGERAVRVAGGAAFPEITTDSAYEANSGDALTLRKALAFARQAAPARRTALVFYSHGCGGSWCARWPRSRTPTSGAPGTAASPPTCWSRRRTRADRSRGGRSSRGSAPGRRRRASQRGSRPRS